MKHPNLYQLTSQHFRVAFVISIMALVVRLAIVYFYPVNTLGDSRTYWAFAQGIASGQGFRSSSDSTLAFWPPMYSYFLAGIFRLLGEEKTTIYVVQAFIGAVATYLFCLCCIRLLGIGGGVFGGISFAILPHFLLFTKQILTEALYIPLLVALLGVMVLLDGERYKYFKWLLIGVLLGLLTLTRREAALSVGLVILAATYYEARPSIPNTLRPLIVAVLTALIVFMPWLFRNWQDLGILTFSTAGGANLLNGNNPDAQGDYTVAPPDWQQQLDKLDEVGQDKLAWELSFNWIRNNPGKFIALIPKKLMALYSLSDNIVIDAADLILVPFYLLGLIRLLRKCDNRFLVAAILVSLVLPITVLSVIFSGNWRFRMITYPGLILLAACSVPYLNEAGAALLSKFSPKTWIHGG